MLMFSFFFFFPFLWGRVSGLAVGSGNMSDFTPWWMGAYQRTGHTVPQPASEPCYVLKTVLCYVSLGDIDLKLIDLVIEWWNLQRKKLLIRLILDIWYKTQLPNIFIHKFWQETKLVKLKFKTYIKNGNHKDIKGRKFSVMTNDLCALQIRSKLLCILIKNKIKRI